MTPKGWPWSYGSWIHNYLCNQCLSPLMLWVWISIRARCTTLCDKVCQWLATGRWFSPGPLVSSTNKTDRHYITEILLKVALHTLKERNKQNYCRPCWVSKHLSSLPVFSGDCVARSLFCVVPCRLLFAPLYFYFWPLSCLSFELMILITTLVSSNFSWYNF